MLFQPPTYTPVALLQQPVGLTQPMLQPPRLPGVSLGAPLSRTPIMGTRSANAPSTPPQHQEQLPLRISATSFATSSQQLPATTASVLFQPSPEKTEKRFRGHQLQQLPMAAHPSAPTAPLDPPAQHQYISKSTISSQEPSGPQPSQSMQSALQTSGYTSSQEHGGTTRTATTSVHVAPSTTSSAAVGGFSTSLGGTTSGVVGRGELLAASHAAEAAAEQTARLADQAARIRELEESSRLIVKGLTGARDSVLGWMWHNTSRVLEWMWHFFFFFLSPVVAARCPRIVRATSLETK